MTTQLELDKWQLQKNMDDICKNYHRGNVNSIEANKIAHKYKIGGKQRILEALDNGQLGNLDLTCEQLEYETGLSHQTCSARLSDLKRDNKIKIVGTRKTRSGSPASVYVAI